MDISKRIQSFAVNHDLLEKGLYLSRIDGNTKTDRKSVGRERVF